MLHFYMQELDESALECVEKNKITNCDCVEIN